MTPITDSHYKLIEFWNHDDNFITALSSIFSSSAGTFLTKDFFYSLSSIYFLNHSGDKTSSKYLTRIVSLTSAIYTSDGYQVYDTDGNIIVLNLNDFNAKVAKDLVARFGKKWAEIDKLFQKDYNAFQSESIEETETPDITKSNVRTKSQNVTTTDNGTDSTTSTPSGSVHTETSDDGNVSAFNETDYSPRTKSNSVTDTSYKNYEVVTEGTNGNTRTVTANAEDNKDTSTLTETGTRKHDITHIGGSDLWSRIEEYKKFESDTLMDIMIKDIDSMLTIPYYL
jgi:hypothetical protein